MIVRSIEPLLLSRLNNQAAVAIIGPRQVGKTTLALAVSKLRPSIYLDLEDADDRAKLDDPQLFFEANKRVLVILDEIHRMPDLFQRLRGVIDRGRREGLGIGRFLVLGSASVDLLRQSGETLAGRIAYLEMTPMTIEEVVPSGVSLERLWLLGGFPGSLFASTDQAGVEWRRDFIRTYLEREVLTFGGRLPSETIGRLWKMLAHRQGSTITFSDLATSLEVSAQSIHRYVDLLVDLMLIRKLSPFYANVGKRLTKSARYYVRDSGILHSLLSIGSMNELIGHPVFGKSWEGFVIEQLIGVLPWNAQPFYYRTQAGAEIDLVIEFSEKERWAIEVKRQPGSVKRGFLEAVKDLQPTRAIVVHGGDATFPMRNHIEAIKLEDLVAQLRDKACASASTSPINYG